jgi:DNA-binding response OmpR family regulator
MAAMRILVLDDEIFVGLEIGDLVESLGHEVVGPVTTIDDARSAVARSAIDLGILDVNLGRGQTSEEVARRLHEAGVPVMFVTAADPGDIGYAQPDDPIIPKPLSRGAIAQAIGRLAERRNRDRP